MAVALLAPVMQARAAVSVSVLATETVSADTRADAGTAAWTTVAPPPEITENLAGDITTRIVITAPTGFQFNTGAAVTAVPGGANNIVLQAAAITTGTITFDVTTPSTSAGPITINGIQIQPINCAGAQPGLRNVTVTTDGGGAGDVSNQPLVALTVRAGALTTFTATANSATPQLGVPSVITLTARDACGNPIANFDPTVNIQVTQAGAATPTTVTYASVPTWAITDNANGTATIAAANPANNFNAAGQYQFQVTNSEGESITFTVSDGTVSTTVNVTWVNECTAGNILVQWSIGPNGVIIIITGTPGPDVILLGVAEITVTIGDEDFDFQVLTVNGELCPGIPLQSIARIIINSLEGDDLINAQALVNDFEADPPQLFGRTVEVNAGDGNDIVFGGDGNDVLNGEAGNDDLRGGKGNDTINGGDGNDMIVGGAGSDAIDGGAGEDTLSYATAVADTEYDGDIGINADLPAGVVRDLPYILGENQIPATDTVVVDSIEILIGTELADTMLGNATVPTVLIGGDGDDDLTGGSAADRIEGGAGNDVLDGGDGDDVLLGGEDNDIISGGDGNDTIDGADGDDLIDGGAGDDTCSGGDGNDEILGGDGADTLSGGDGDDLIDGGAGDDTCSGGDGDDFIDGGDDNDILFGGLGGDTMLGGGGHDIMYGNDGDDQMFGGDGNDYMDAGPGNDGIKDPLAPVDGGPGDDIVLGGAGDDVLTGGDGRNVIRGMQGNDDLWVFGGYDVADYSRSPDPISLNLPAGTCDDGYGTTDTIHAGFSIFRGSSHNDTMIAYRGASTILLGGPGNDNLTGSAVGGDILYGESGNDTINGDPTDLAADEDGGADIIFGGSGNDTLAGGPGSDEIYGDGDFVPQNFDELATAPDYYPDDQMIQLVQHPRNPAIPMIDPNVLDGIMNIRNCLGDYDGSQTTVGNAFALPASEMVDPLGGPPALAFPGVGSGADTIRGGGGADRIAGGGGPDQIYGGTHQFHADIPENELRDIYHDFADLIFGDYFVNRPAALALFGTWAAYPALVEDLDRPFGADQIRGGFGADLLIGCGGADQINGNRGDDVIYGDFFFDAGDDATYALITSYGDGLPWNDWIRGNEGTDYIFGGPGNDVLIGGDEADPEGFSERGWEANYGKLVEFGDVMQGNSGNDILVGGDMNALGRRNETDDLIDRGFFNGSVACIAYESGPASCWGVDSVPQDTIDYSMVPPGTGINVDLGNNVPGGWYTMGIASDDGEGGTDRIYGIENVVGSRNADVIKGSTRSDESLPYQYSGRYRNYLVTDAFGVVRFPDYPTHPSNPFYQRTMVRYIYGWDNILLGEDGNDTLIGRRGADALCGGNGNDKLWGDGQFESDAPPGALDPDNPATNGNDELWGDAGDDEIYGEWGDDIVHGGAGNDYLSGGNGIDTLAFTETDELQTGGVVVNLTDGSVDMAVWGDLATQYAGFGWPLNPVTTLLPLTGWPAETIRVPDDVNLGQMVDLQFPGGTVLPGWPYNPANTAAARGLGVARVGGFYDVIVNRHVAPGPQPPGAVLHPDRFEVVYGTATSDVIYGHATAPTVIYGDVVEFNGAGASDILIGGAADDTLYGELGNDVLEGRGGDDLLVGGDPLPTPPGPQLNSPVDWVSYNSAPSGVTVNLAETEKQDTVSAGKDRLVEIINVLGSPFADNLTGNWRVNVLLGSGGDDTLIGRSDHDIQQGNKTYITSDTLHGGPGNDTADYRLGNPAQVAAAAAQVVFGPCPAPNAANTCGYMSSDGEGGSDTLVDIENIRTPDNSLLLTPPAKKTISPGQSVRLDFYVSGGDGRYKAEFDPTIATKPRLAADGTTVLGTKKVAILAAPADQNNPATPFVLDEDMPDYRAVRTLTGVPAGNGMWRFSVYARPLATTSFRVTVSDMNDPNLSPDAPGRKQTSRLVEVVVTNQLKVVIEQPEYIITAGQSIQLRGSVTGGIPPYLISWAAEDGSQGTTLSATNILIPVAKPAVTTRYTLTVQDSTPDSLNQQGTATTKVTVLTTSSGSGVPSGGGTNNTTGGTNNTTGGTNNSGTTNTDSTQSVPNEVSNEGTADAAPLVTPMCGFGVTSWVMLGNLLALAVMKRRRW